MSNYTKNIFKLILGVLLICLLANCSTVKHVPIETRYEIIKKDSIIYKVKDSLRIIPIERIVNVTAPDQKSSLETSLAKSEAYTDSLGFLHHSLENKKDFHQQKTQIEKESVKADTIRVKEPVPYEVEVPVKYVPKFYNFTFWWFISSILATILYFLLKHFKRKLYL